MSYWAAAQLQPQRDQLALHCLKLFGFETYAPRLRDRRIVRGREVIKTPLLFPRYAFVLIELQWIKAQYSPGVARLVMDGFAPGDRPRCGGCLAQGARGQRPDRTATTATAVPARRLCPRAARAAQGACRTVRRDEAARSGRCAADDVGRFASCRACWCRCRAVAVTHVSGFPDRCRFS